MVSFNQWCNTAATVVNGHDLSVLSSRDAQLPAARDFIAAAVPGHYASEEHVASILERLGKAKAAAFIRQKLPQTKAIRSGDLGEILATEYIGENTPYAAPIKRLRWKDHRNMAMRGDDVIAIARNAEANRLRFLKTEVKSRVNLAVGVVAEARETLDQDQGLPSPHALSFISQRLREIGNRVLADAIDDAQLKDGIVAGDVAHMMFTFSGNEPTHLLEASLQGYQGVIHQNGVGLRVAAHAQFVTDVYEKVIANGDDG